MYCDSCDALVLLKFGAGVRYLSLSRSTVPECPLSVYLGITTKLYSVVAVKRLPVHGISVFILEEKVKILFQLLHNNDCIPCIGSRISKSKNPV